MLRDTFQYSMTKILEATTQVITVAPARDGTFVCVQTFSITNETSSPTRIDFGYTRGEVFYPLKSEMAPAAGQTVLFPNEFYMLLDDKPGVRIVGGVIADHIQINVGGYIAYNKQD